MKALSPSCQPPTRSSTQSFRTSVPDCSSVPPSVSPSEDRRYGATNGAASLFLSGKNPAEKPLCSSTEMFVSIGRVCASQFQPCAFTRQTDLFYGTSTATETHAFVRHPVERCCRPRLKSFCRVVFQRRAHTKQQTMGAILNCTASNSPKLPPLSGHRLQTSIHTNPGSFR